MPQYSASRYASSCSARIMSDRKRWFGSMFCTSLFSPACSQCSLQSTSGESEKMVDSLTLMIMIRRLPGRKESNNEGGRYYPRLSQESQQDLWSDRAGERHQAHSWPVAG